MLLSAKNGAKSDVLQKIRDSKTYSDAIIASGKYLGTGGNNIHIIGSSYNNITGTTDSVYGYWDASTQSFKKVDGSAFSGTPTASTTVATATSDLPNEVVEGTPDTLRTFIQTKAEETGVPASLISAVIKQESGFNTNASNINDKETSYGLGQINLKAHPEITKEQATNPEFAIDFVANRLKGMIDKYGLYEGVQAYNTPGAIGSQQLIKYANNILASAGIKQTPVVNDEVNSYVSLVEKGELTTKEALDKVSKLNKVSLQQELAKIEVNQIVSEYSKERSIRVVASVDELLSQVNPFTVGWGSLLKQVPTSASLSFSEQLTTLSANITFNELTAMREASKTGGALGQVSDTEGRLLGNALGALGQAQSVEQMKTQLNKIKSSINRWQNSVNQYKDNEGISSVDLSDINFKF